MREELRPGDRVRQRAVDVLQSWERGEGFVDQVLSGSLADVRDPRDRALLNQLVYGVVRRRRWLNHVIDVYCKRNPRGLPPVLRSILQVALFQAHYLDRVPARAAVDAAVRHARAVSKSRGVPGFVNAVLRRSLREGLPGPPSEKLDPVTHLGVSTSHPDWLVHRWLQRYGRERTLAILEWDNGIPDTCVSPAPGTTPEVLEKALAEEGVTWEPSEHLGGHYRCRGWSSMEASPSYRSGLFFVQDLSTALFSRLGGRPAGEAWDACAAPGGKSVALAALGNDDDLVWSTDPSPERLDRLRDTVERLGIRSIRLAVADARRPPFSRPVPLVFVDAPCSGTGVLRRRADLRWRLKPDDLKRLPRLQSELLESCAQVVAPDGLLVYSTCSIEPEENEAVVRRFLSSNREFRPLPPGDSPLVGTGDVSADIREAAVLLPGRFDADGGFGVVLQRVGRRRSR